MKVPFSWLAEFIELEAGPTEVAEILTFGGLEVEEIYDHYETLGEIVTVKILKVEEPPGLKELLLCEVTDGREIFPVLTGAKGKVVPGLIVALARPGSKTFFWEKVEVKEVRGYKSWGMFLSPFEAGLSEDKGSLLSFPPNTPLGAKVYQVLKVSEPILEVAITPNRGDALSIWGIARELSLLTDWPLKFPVLDPSLEEGNAPLGKVEIWDEDGCFRYLGRWFSGIRVTSSPLYIQKRLIFSGLRPINNIVDITNYVMLELGQPLHAFDWGRIEGGKIIVRSAKEGEILLFLDGIERQFSADDMLIADERKPLVLAGIMGGEDSGVGEATNEVFLEAAWFNPKRIRMSTRRHRLTTESSYRFERKVDPEGVKKALLRATQMILEIVKPQSFSQIVDVYKVQYEPTPIELPRKKIKDYLGIEIPQDKVKSILSKLGDLTEEEDFYRVVPFSFRQDLSIPEDLIEEIARVYGYEKIPTTYPHGALYRVTLPKERKIIERIKEFLINLGFYETITYSFVDPKLITLLNFSKDDKRAHPIALENPISSEMSVLRTSLLPGLLLTAQFNQRREVENLKIFEIGKVFYRGADLAEERINLGVLLGGKTEPEWYEETRPYDIFDLKGIVEALQEILRQPFEFRPYSEEPFLRKGLSFDIYLGEKKVGFFGRFKSLLVRELDLLEPIWVAEIYLDALLPAYQEVTKEEITKPPKFPSTFHDVSLIAERTLSVERILKFIQNYGLSNLEKMKLIKIYEGPPIPEDKRSLTFRLWFRAEDCTLRYEEVEPLVEELVKTLTEKFKVLPR